MSPTTTAKPSSGRLRKLLARGARREDIADFLNELCARERVDQALSVTGKAVGKLYRAVGGGPALTLEHFVPEGTPVASTVIFEGRNSLPAFSRFQKRFARIETGQVVGYNHQTMAFATGPGFFVVKEGRADADVPGELYFDYTDVPQAVPPGWPRYKPNAAGLSHLVYYNMKDYMRQVANNVFVGEAYKLGKRQNQFFILCRQDD